MKYCFKVMTVIISTAFFCLSCAYGEVISSKLYLHKQIQLESKNVAGILPSGKDNFLIYVGEESFNVNPKQGQLSEALSKKGYRACDLPSFVDKSDRARISFKIAEKKASTIDISTSLSSIQGYYPDRLSISCDGKHLFYFDDFDDGLIVIDAESQKRILNELWDMDQTYSLVDPTGRHALLVSSQGNEYILWRFPQTKIKDIPIRLELDRPIFSGNGDILLVGRDMPKKDKDMVGVYTVDGANLIGQFEANKYAVTNNGDYVAAYVESEGIVYIYGTK